MKAELKRKIFLINGLLILTSFGFIGKQKTLIHKIRFTASSVHLVEWNAADTINTAFVKEIVDEFGRTRELRFYNERHQLDWTGSGFYGGSIIRYDYEASKIIETFFSSDNEIANDFETSEVPYKHIYFLDELNQIVDIKQIYKIDFEWTKESLEKTIKHLDFYKQFSNEGSELINVFGYNYAYSKMNGINPIRRK